MKAKIGRMEFDVTACDVVGHSFVVVGRTHDLWTEEVLFRQGKVSVLTIPNPGHKHLRLTVKTAEYWPLSGHEWVVKFVFYVSTEMIQELSGRNLNESLPDPVPRERVTHNPEAPAKRAFFETP
jgi:hypothetical protein